MVCPEPVPAVNGANKLPLNEYSACHKISGQNYGGNLVFFDGHAEFPPPGAMAR